MSLYIHRLSIPAGDGGASPADYRMPGPEPDHPGRIHAPLCPAAACRGREGPSTATA